MLDAGQGRELVAAEASGDPAGTGPFGEAVADGCEHSVADGVSVQVVEVLEPVCVRNARVLRFLDWCDDEPGRLPIVGGGSGSGFHWP